MPQNTTRYKPYTLRGEPSAMMMEQVDEMFSLLFQDTELVETRALLASTLVDVSAGSPSEGALIVGSDDVTSKWEVLTAGAEGEYLRMTDGLPDWTTSVTPGATDSGNVGSSALVWANGFFNDLFAPQTLVVGDTSGPPTEIVAHVQKGSAGTDPAWGASDVLLVENTAGSNAVVQVFTSAAAVGGYAFADTGGRNRGGMFYNHSADSLAFDVNGSANVFLITSAGLFNFSTDAGVGIIDTNASHYMRLDCGSNLTADRVLSFVPGDAARTITLTGNPTLADWFDQAVKAASSPTFAALTLTSPLTVANGGSSRATATAYAVLCGGTTATAAHQSIAGVGTATQVLTSNGASALPTFQNAPNSPRIVASTLFETSARFSLDIDGSGFTTFNSLGMLLTTGATAGSYSAGLARVLYGATGDGTMNIYPGEFGAAFAITTLGTDLNASIGLGYYIDADGVIDYTQPHVGFKLLRTASGTCNLYATQADGVTETASSALTAVAVDDAIQVYIRLASATEIHYFWRLNGGAWSSATTLTTNAGDLLINYMSFVIGNVNVASSSVLTCRSAFYSN